MSEPDAVPLPREGEVFFDVRGEARSMRLSWYANSKVAVFSIWQGNRCTGTFRLPFADLARMVQTLQSGPPVPAHQPRPQPEDYGADPMIHYEQDRRYDYGTAVASAGYGAGLGYGEAQDYGTGQGYGPGDGYGADQGYDSYDASEPYRGSESYGGSEPYHPSEQYRGGEQYRASEPYHATEQHLQSGPYRPLRHAADQSGHGLTDYAPPNYGDVPPYREDRTRASGPSAAQGLDDWLPPAVPAPPNRGGDSESVPDTAMMSFPSVPARNGPSGYR